MADSIQKVTEGIKKANDGEKAPQKRFFRQRAHCNPLSHNDTFEYPSQPSAMNWSDYYPALCDVEGKMSKPVEFLDIGCGFGGLTVALAKEFPESVVLGMEIRQKVTEFVNLRIKNLRRENSGEYENASVMRTNAMRYLPMYFEKGQMKKMFFCFPDPHIKVKNHRRRIVSNTLLADYAYLLQPGGVIYTITDVSDLNNWMVKHLEEHPLFERYDAEADNDPTVPLVKNATEEGQKVSRNKMTKYFAAYKRIESPSAPMLIPVVEEEKVLLTPALPTPIVDLRNRLGGGEDSQAKADELLQKQDRQRKIAAEQNKRRMRGEKV